MLMITTGMRNWKNTENTVYLKKKKNIYWSNTILYFEPIGTYILGRSKRNQQYGLWPPHPLKLDMVWRNIFEGLWKVLITFYNSNCFFLVFFQVICLPPPIYLVYQIKTPKGFIKTGGVKQENEGGRNRLWIVEEAQNAIIFWKVTVENGGEKVMIKEAWNIVLKSWNKKGLLKSTQYSCS